MPDTPEASEVTGTPEIPTDTRAEETEPGAPMEFDELNDLADKGELTQETLQQQLATYRKSLESEFKLSVDTDPDKVHEQTLDFFKKETPEAAVQIVWLAHNAESESVRKDLLKFIVQQGLSDARQDGDPIKDLINSLTKVKPNSSNPNNEVGVEVEVRKSNG